MPDQPSARQLHQPRHLGDANFVRPRDRVSILDRDLLRRDPEPVRGESGDPITQHRRCRPRGVADGKRGAAALRAIVVGHGLGIDGGNAYGVERQAQCLGEHLTRARQRAGAEFDRPAAQRRGAIGVELNVNAGGPAGGHPPAAGDAFAAAGGGPPFMPADRLCGFAQAFLDADGAERFAGRPGIAVAHDVTQPQFQRIDPEIIGDDVHLQFDREVAHRASRRAERSGGHLVRVHRQAIQ